MEGPGPQVAVGAIVIHDGTLLMVRRGKEPGRGLWSLPGGKVETGEYLAEALRREVVEETGLEVTVGDLVGIFEVIGHVHYVVLDFFAEVETASPPRPAGDADEARWVPLDEVVGLQCTPRFVETLRAWGVLEDPLSDNA